MRIRKGHPNQEGTTLVEIIVVVAILGFFVVALGGLLRAITVARRNLPNSGQVQTYQEVVSQINVFLTTLSRDVREAKSLGVNIIGSSERLLISGDERAFIAYEYRKNGDGEEVTRDGKVMIRGVHKEEGSPPIFQVVNDSSVIVTLPVRYLSQTKRGSDALETRVFSFTVERRLSPSP